MTLGVDTLGQLSSVFNRRFVLNALLPTLFFSSSCAAVTLYSFGHLTDAAQWWASLDALSRLATAFAYLTSSWFLASAVSDQWRGIIRLFEGYPLRRVFGEGTPGVAWHKARRDLLWFGDYERDIDPDHPRAYYRYAGTPDGQQSYPVLPTRLGNILLAAERYSKDRYGIDAIYFWPRLYPLLPEAVQREHEEFILDHEFPLVVSFEAAVTSVAGGVALVIGGGNPLLFLVWFIGFSVVAYSAYILSLANAEELGEQQRTAFDLYRHLLLDQWPTPADISNEKQAFQAIENFIIENENPGWGVPQGVHQKRHSRPSK